MEYELKNYQKSVELILQVKPRRTNVTISIVNVQILKSKLLNLKLLLQVGLKQ